IIMDNNIITNTHDIKTHIQQYFNRGLAPGILMKLFLTLHGTMNMNLKTISVQTGTRVHYSSSLLRRSLLLLHNYLTTKLVALQALAMRCSSMQAYPFCKQLHLYSTDALHLIKYPNNGRKVESF